ncbi:MAG: hypothetical protein PHF67_02045 [Candidatus Nanoarchaeia archaeon]|nr:hypothetical protein [Candidatus Nanoarchaeia archaeon]
MVTKKYFLIAISLILIPMVLAQWGSWGYYDSPDMLFNNEWVIFAVIMLVFFSVIFYTVNKAFKNKAVAGTIAIALSLLIAITFSSRGYLYNYAGSGLGSWIVIFVFLLSMVFLMVFLYEGIGPFGPFLGGIGLWFLIANADPYSYLPSELLSSSYFYTIYDIISRFWGLIIMLLISLLVTWSLRRSANYRSRYGGSPDKWWYPH